MAAVTIIKLTGENHRDIDAVATQIKTICDNGGISLRGPIPLPTKKRKYCVIRSPHVDKKSREQFEIRIHKRLLEIYTPQNVENIADSFLKIAIPPGVSIKLS